MGFIARCDRCCKVNVPVGNPKIRLQSSTTKSDPYLIYRLLKTNCETDIYQYNLMISCFDAPICPTCLVEIIKDELGHIN